jgi:hypothetical protein
MTTLHLPLPDHTALFLTTVVQHHQHKINLASDPNRIRIPRFFLLRYRVNQRTPGLTTPAVKPLKMTCACLPLHRLVPQPQQPIILPAPRHPPIQISNHRNKAAYLQCPALPHHVQVLAVRAADQTP